MTADDIIYIKEQFERASEVGYLRAHGDLTKKLDKLFERDDHNPDRTMVGTLAERRRDDLFHQACEDVARHLLLTDEVITTIPVAAVERMVADRYQSFVENPERAASSRALAVH